MSRYTAFVTVSLVLVLVLGVVSPSSAFLLPWRDRGDSSPLSEQLVDPFRILEHVPFVLDRDDAAMVALARVDWRETPNSHEIIIDVPGMLINSCEIVEN